MLARMPALSLVIRSRVLLPRQRLQLRVHDIGAAEAIAGFDSFASVFSARPGHVSGVGVEAHVVARLPATHGRLDVEVIGRRRFRMADREGSSGDRVEVEFLEEPLGSGDLDLLLDELQRGWRRFAAAAAESGEAAAIHARLHRDPVIASYQAATLLPLLHPERQELLEITTTTDRLERLLRIVAGETGILRHLLATGRMGA